MSSLRLATALLALVVGATPALAGPATAPVTLHGPRTCLAGGSDTPRGVRASYRVQYGMFDSLDHAEAFVATLDRAGVAADVWLGEARWAEEGEAYFVVSRAEHRSMTAARRAARAGRRAARGAFPRRFLVPR